MSEADHLKRKEQRNSEHTNKNTGSDASPLPPRNDSTHRLTKSSRSSEQFLLGSREREVEQAHEEDTAGKKERRLAGDQFSHDLWYKPREELDESPPHKGCPGCKSLCKCPGAWRWWPGWGGN
ncbi:hypothetical protein BPOR_0547g00030 [Botrytis porri]|uniref:Uncharacterized protein n=1 Tax=Botrytis porri TaxID=87229 RepID=A0A4Z1KKK4_9HELO|nr:hypothetical protein BPOR_0547g00030 [Botrytis porri]